ncbi:MAG TPA: phosphotransferase [Candidatus Limnocylindria bacterium]|nr:phosphotransferase [Candidatus Limnocylindria bacterium]
MDVESSLGGNLNSAVRVGDTVRRRAGPWTPAVHALLRHLESVGFEAPRVLGTDDQGREILRFISGEAHSGTIEPVPDRIVADDHLLQAARLLHRYHDAVARFEPPPNARWRLTAPTAHELICHNDWSPWNGLFRDGRLALMLDWDLAGPGSRLWDVVNAAYCWVPLFAGERLFDLAERARRLGLFCDAYGVDDRAAVIPMMGLRILFIARFVEEQARAGDPGFIKLVSMDVPAKMAHDAAYLDEHRTTLERALGR